MKRENKNVIILAVIFIMTSLSLFADVDDDIRVIYGLYHDSNYNLAMQEIQRFRQMNPSHPELPALQVIEGNVALHRSQYKLADSLFQIVDSTKLDEYAQADLLLSQIQVKYYLGDYALSTSLASQYLHRYPKSGDSWQAIYWSARLSIKYQKYDDAIKSLHMIEDRPEHNIIYSSLVEAYALKLQTRESQKYLELLIQNYPKDEYTNQAYINQIQALYTLEKYDSLSTYLSYPFPEKSLYFKNYLLLLSKAAYMQSDYTKSMDYLNRIQPEVEETRFYKALNFYQLKLDGKAKVIFTDLANNAKDDQVRSNSFLQNQIIISETDQKTALFNLEWFVQKYPKDPLLGAYYFQIGYIFYKQSKYNLAFNKLSKAISYRLDAVTEDKTYYLLGDIYYLTGDKTAAELSFLDYMKLIRNGLFVDEVLCKLGFIYYDMKETETAKTCFQKILDQYPGSSKTAISNFYLGEINYYKSNYIIAKNFYTQALKGKLDKGYIWLRISQCDYFIEDYTNAMANLANIPDKKEFLFDKYLLKGNVFFNDNEYLKAIDAYKIAEKHYQSKAEWEQVISQEGLAYYLLKRYREATDIYKQLSKEASAPDKFLLLAANSAFSAQDYKQSTYLYTFYLNNHPDAENRDKALLGIADSYYNLGNYSQATADYIDVLQQYQTGRISEDALKALGWSLRLAKEHDFTASLTNLEEMINDPTLKSKVKRIHLDYVRYMKEWSKTIAVADDLLRSDPADLKIQLFKAEALGYLKKFDEADSVFQKLQPESLGPDTYLSWANLDIMRGDSLAALAKLKIASQRTNDPIVWIPLLTMQSKLDDPDFNDKYDSFIKSKPASGIDEVELIWCERALEKQLYENVKPRLIQLMKSNDRQIRGKAEFLEAKLTFQTGKMQDAILELARIKYLYPELTGQVLESQYLLCIAYIQIKDIDTARTIFNSIKADLNSFQVSYIEKGLSSSGGGR